MFLFRWGKQRENIRPNWKWKISFRFLVDCGSVPLYASLPLWLWITACPTVWICDHMRGLCGLTINLPCRKSLMTGFSSNHSTVTRSLGGFSLESPTTAHPLIFHRNSDLVQGAAQRGLYNICYPHAVPPLWNVRNLWWLAVRLWISMEAFLLKA